MVHHFSFMPDTKLTIKYWAEEDRPREKLILKGKQTLSDAELIAILIGSGNAGQSAVELSREMLAAVNNDLFELGRRSLKDLMEFKGIGEAKAVCIIAALELGRRRAQAEARPQERFISDKVVFELMSPILSDLPHEEFWIICLNRNGRLISKHRISSGGISGTVADMKMIFNTAVKELASGIILCHNHPSGNIYPSESDKHLTRKAIEGGRFLEIEVFDHIIIGHQQYFSFREQNLM